MELCAFKREGERDGNSVRAVQWNGRCSNANGSCTLQLKKVFNGIHDICLFQENKY